MFSLLFRLKHIALSKRSPTLMDNFKRHHQLLEQCNNITGFQG